MFKCYNRPFLQMLKFSSRYGHYKNVTFCSYSRTCHQNTKKNLKIKVIAIDNEEKTLFVLHMTVKSIVTMMQFRALFTWKKE